MSVPPYHTGWIGAEVVGVGIITGRTYTWSVDYGGALILDCGLGDPYPGGEANFDPDADFVFQTFVAVPLSTTGPLMRVNANGRVGIGTVTPGAKLHSYTTENEYAGYFRISNSGSTRTALYCTTNGTGLAFRANGTARVDVLEIEGADVAERFPVSEEVQPGLVVAIDPQHPGQLCLARGAYNRRVAGVVSGAGDLPTGAVLGHLAGNEDAPPIALSGRVWAYCDATEQPIEPGDLLTTSDAPGHAMKVTDYARAQGAVIGKAMTGLEQGETGLVLVLVNLQ